MRFKNNKQNSPKSIGHYILLDLYDCQNSYEPLESLGQIFSEGLQKGNFTVVSQHHHTFEPHGISGVYVLSESHFAYHIWCELNFV